MTEPLRRGGRFLDDAGRAVTWSIADGQRGRRWRWIVVDRRGALLVAHVLETDPGGAFVRLESAAAPGLLTLHREADESLHGNRVSERGVEHLAVEAPAPGRLLVGGTGLGVAALLAGMPGPPPRSTLDIVEIGDDLGVRLVTCTILAGAAGVREVRTNRVTRRVTLGEDGLPDEGDREAVSWPLELR